MTETVELEFRELSELELEDAEIDLCDAENVIGRLFSSKPIHGQGAVSLDKLKTALYVLEKMYNGQLEEVELGWVDAGESDGGPFILRNSDGDPREAVAVAPRMLHEAGDEPMTLFPEPVESVDGEVPADD